MGRYCCRGYTTRSYNFDGSTNWTRNYYDGTTGVPPQAEMSVAIDDDNNIYTVGVCCEASGKTWSGIAYNEAGDELWRLDLRQLLRDQLHTSADYRIDVWDVCVIPGGKLVVATEAVNFSNPNLSSSDYRLWTLNAADGSLDFFDGTIAKTSKDVGVLVPPAQIVGFPDFRLEVWKHPTKPALLLPYNDAVQVLGGLGSQRAHARNDDGYLIETSSSRERNPFGYSMIWFRPTIVDTPMRLPGTAWANPGHANNWNWGFYAARPPKLVTDAFPIAVSTITASLDGERVYAGADYLSCILNGVGVSYQFVRMIPGMEDYTQSKGVGLSGPHLGTGRDNIYWGINNPVSSSAALADGVAVYSSVNPRIRALSDDDGTRLWGHSHQVVTDMEASETKLVTVGTYFDGKNDLDFI